MLGGLLDKISASLGKSFLWAGLLPSAVMLTIGSLYWFDADGAWTQVEGLIGEGKSISRILMIWLVLGFILFAIRAWIFARFRILPTRRFGSLLLYRPLRNRKRV